MRIGNRKAAGGRTALTAFASLLALVAATPASSVPGGSYVVVLEEGASATAVVERLELTAEHTYNSAFAGFSAVLTNAERAEVLADPAVTAIIPDRVLIDHARAEHAGSADIKPPNLDARQEIPTGVRRIGGLTSPTADIDGLDDSRVDIDIAVIDDGVQLDHPDLNVLNHMNCFGKSYREDTHGTHVAGTIGALDNGIGVVGVAPGARIWAVRMFSQNNKTTLSAFLCALDYVDRNADAIEVANLSASFPGFDDGTCGVASNDPVHAAICDLYEKGVTFVTAAGNSSDDAANWSPVSFEQTIGVSALVDYDGQPGGLGSPTCADGGDDDTFAFFSNFGPDVDLMAPGVCILSTWVKNGYEYSSGTSMATPHVAGAAALYLATHPDTSPEDVKTALQASGDHTPVPGDPDGFHEPVVDVSGF